MVELLFNRYKVIQKIETKSQNDVFKVFDTLTGQVLALKILRKFNDTEAKNDFKIEFERLKTLNSPSLVRVYDFSFSSNKELYFTMDFVNGVHFDSFFKNASCENQTQILNQIAWVLQYLHSQNLIHGDLKPQNILVTENEGFYSVKLIDFGLSNFTKSTKISGTFEFLLPEEIEKKDFQPQEKDFYALGVTIFQGIFGKTPFADEDLNKILEKKITYQNSELAEKCKNLPQVFNKLILSLLNREKNKRLKDWNDFFKILQGNFQDLQKNKDFHKEKFTGRETELQTLENAFEKILDFEPSAILIEGEAGIGKSRLISEFKSYLQLKEQLVFTANSLNNTQNENFYSANKILTQFLFVDEFREFLTEDYRNSFAKIFQNKKTEQEFSQEQVFTCFYEFCSKASKIKPVTIVLDNVQNEDFGGIELWSHFLKMLKRFKNTSILLLVSQRTEEKSTLNQSLFDKKLVLKELGKDEVLGFLGSAFNQKEAVELCEEIFAETKGNPLLLVESLGFLVQNFNSNYKENLKKIPKAFEEIALKRLETIGKNELALLTELSVFGNSFDKNFSENLNPALLETLVENNFLEKKENSFEFKHPKFREVVYSKIPENEKAKKHSKIAEFFLKTPENYTELLAFHLSKGEKPVLAIPFLLKSSENASNSLAYRNAKNHLLEVEKILSKIETKTKKELEFEFETLRLLYFLAGTLGYQEEKPRIFRSLEVSKILGKPKFCVTAFLNLAHYFSLQEPNPELATKYVNEGMSFYQNGEEKDKLYLDLLLAKTWFLDFSDSKKLELSQEALKIAEKLQDFYSLSIVNNNIGLIFSYLGKDFEALELYEKALYFALKRGLNSEIITAKLNLVSQVRKLFSPETFEKMIDSLFEQTKKTHSLVYEAYTSVILAQNCLMLHDFDKLSKCLRNFESVVKELENKDFELRLETEKMKYYGELGYLDSSLEIAEKILSTEKISLVLHWQALVRKALILAKFGKFEQAKELLNPAKSVRKEEEFVDALRFYHAKLLFDFDEFSEAKKQFSEVLQGKKNRFFEGRANISKSYLARLENDFAGAKEVVNNRLFYGHSKTERHEILWNFYQTAKSTNQNSVTQKQILDELFISVLESAKKISSKTDRENFIRNGTVVKNVFTEFFKFNYQNAEETREKFIDFCLLGEVGINVLNYDANALLETLSGEKFEGVNFNKIIEISKILNSSSEPQIVLNNLMDLAIDYLKANRGLVIFYDKETENFTLKVGRNIEKETIYDVTQISKSIVKNVSQKGKPIFSCKLDEDERFSQNVSVINLKIRSLVCVPLLKGSEIIGTIYLDSVTEKKSFSEKDAFFLEAIGNLAVVAMENAENYQKISTEKIKLQKAVEEKFNFHNIISQDAKMLKIFSELLEIAKTDISVMIFGESGTGKELVAKAIHFQSKRKEKNFIAIDCGAISETIIESELFGHKKGSFSGAFEDKKGLFEEADGGTIFLDEITNTSLSFQAKLLRVLQEQEIRRVGENFYRKINVRVITATNLNIEETIKNGKFREDLYFRLNNFPISLPPLRERKGDVSLLVNNFMKDFCETYNKTISGVSQKLLDYFETLEWKGNVRELRSVVGEMILRENEDFLRMESLPERIKISYNSAPKKANLIDSKLVTFDENERRYIQHVLEATNGNQSEAARILNLPRPTLRSKMKKLGMI
ncbi:sigma 54-interacting transcriptional regulator [bacterium]|nr:sigma 54-interacting transcriptional regulator [bacterium]